MLLSILMCLHFNMQEENILEHIGVQCHFVYTLVDL